MQPTEGGAFTLPSVGRLASVPPAAPSDMRKHPTTCEIHRSGDLAANRPSACSVALGGRALRASDLCKSSARASLVEALADGLSNCRRFAAKSALDQPR